MLDLEIVRHNKVNGYCFEGSNLTILYLSFHWGSFFKEIIPEVANSCLQKYVQFMKGDIVH